MIEVVRIITTLFEDMIIHMNDKVGALSQHGMGENLVSPFYLSHCFRTKSITPLVWSTLCIYICVTNVVLLLGLLTCHAHT